MNPSPPRSGIFGLLVDRPVLTGMIVLAMLVVGSISLWRLPLTFMGDAQPGGSIRVWINSGRVSSPQENQDKVARPTEELLRTIPGMRRIQADSSRSGVRFSITYAADMDPRLMAAEIRDRLQRAMKEWPEGVDRYFTWRQDGSSAPLQMIQVLTPTYSQAWMDKVETIVQPRLEAVDGIGQVQFWGLNKQSIVIWFDRDKLNANRIDYRELLGRLAGDNYSAPAGELRGENSRVLVRVDSKFRDLADIENYVVRPGLLIKDVARVGYDRREERNYSRYNERFTMSGSIRATSETNPVEASARVRAVCEELKQDPRLAGISFRFWFDQGEFIKSGLDSLKTTSLQGGLLAILVLFLFLRNVRATLAIAVAIPLTLLLVADYLYFSGSSLNILTMTGMTLAVGMVIDNSVVVLENIRRLRHEGMDLRSACIQGAREMSLAVTMATLTTVVVFAPMIFLISNPQMRSMSAAVGGPLSVALLGSLFVGLLLLPSAVRRMGGMSAKSEIKISNWSPVELFTRAGMRSVPFLMRWRYAIAATCLLLAIGGLNGLPILPKLEFESGDQSPFRSGDISMKLSLPKGMEIEDVHEEVKNYEALLRSNREAWKIKSYRTRYGRTEISLDLELLDEVRPAEQAELRDVIVEGLPRRPGIKMVLRGQDENSSAEADLRNFVVRIRGRDADTLTRIAQQLQRRLERHPDVEMAEVAGLTDNKEVVMSVDRDRLQDLAVMPEALFGTLQGGLQGRDISRIQKDEREIRVIAQYGTAKESSMDDLRETQVFSSKGAFQRLSDLGDIRFEPTMPGITRIDGKTSSTIIGRRITGVGPREFTEKLKRMLSQYSFPVGYSWIEDSPARDTAEQIKELAMAGGLSVLLVFFLMGVLFESVVLPTAILSTIAVAVFGGLWSLRLFWGSIDPLAITGLVILAGVVVNNGIVLLDCIERLRRDGRMRQDAIIEGIRIRLRPIMMTAATTVVGLLPMALFGEATGQGISYKSMSIAVAGGLTLCTLFTAPVVALSYAILDDVSRVLVKVLRSVIATLREGVLGSAQAPAGGSVD